jgi:hypothetical protein
MSLMFGFLGVLGFVFGVVAYTRVEALEKRLAALEARPSAPRA